MAAVWGVVLFFIFPVWSSGMVKSRMEWGTDLHSVASEGSQMAQVRYIFFDHIGISQEQHLLAEMFSKTKCRSSTTHGLYRHICEMLLASTQTQGLGPALPSCGSCPQSKSLIPAHLDIAHILVLPHPQPLPSQSFSKGSVGMCGNEREKLVRPHWKNSSKKSLWVPLIRKPESKTR